MATPSPPAPTEFFPERSPEPRGWAGLGLALAGLGAILTGLGWDVSPKSWEVPLFMGALSVGCFLTAGVLWWRRRMGWQATPHALVEVFRWQQSREYVWDDVQEIREAAAEDGLSFTIKTTDGKVTFDSRVKGWERLVARIRAEIQVRHPERSEAPTESAQPDDAQIAAWLEAEGRSRLCTFRYGYKLAWRLLGLWGLFLAGLVLMGVVVRLGGKGGMLGLAIIAFLGFLTTSRGLFYALRRARRAQIAVDAEGLVLVDDRGGEHRYRWTDLLSVQQVERWYCPWSLTQRVRALIAPRATQVRTPWGYFEFDAGLQGFEELRSLIEEVIALRGGPPDYPAARMLPSDAALSRARPADAPALTERALSRADAPAEEKPRLTETQTESREWETVEVSGGQRIAVTD